MEKKLFKFPSIEQFRNVIRNVTHNARYVGKDEAGEPIYDPTAKLPVLNYKGTIKLHGTNAGIVYQWNPLTFDYEFHAQSRENIITPAKDNAAFSAFVHTTDTEGLLAQIMKVFKEEYTPEVVRVYGEWCGGNIQKGVGISGLPKMFVIFAIKIDKTWLSNEQLQTIKLPEKQIYNILDFPTYDIKIDFNDPVQSTNHMIDLTMEVEKECPVGKHFGNSGIGEGIVWKCVDEGWRSSDYWFKVKGEKHSSSKTKTLAPVDIEKVNSMNEMVENFLTESRLNQGLEHLRSEGLEIDRKNVGQFLRWIFNDVLKEELDTIVDNGFEPKQISGNMSNKARTWFFEQELKQVNKI